MESKANMEETIRVLREDGDAMGKEITSLKRQIAGYKGRIKQYQEKVETLKLANTRLEKRIGVADERTLVEIDTLKTTLCGKDKTIDGLESQVNELKSIIADRDETIQCLRTELSIAEANYNDIVSLPWYKRIFYKA